MIYFSPFVPFAGITHAGGRYLHYYLERLSESFDITLVAPGSAANLSAETHPERPPVRLHLVPVRRQPRTTIGHLPRLVANSLAGVTPGWQVLRGFRHDTEVWSLVAGADLVELGWAWNLAFVPDIRKVAPRIPITAFEHDVLTESLSRRTRDGYLHERTLGLVRAARARSLEPKLLNRCDAVFVFSGRDRELLRDLAVVAPISVVDPHVERRSLASPPSDHPPTVLFVGSMDRPENHQGAIWMVDEVWPLVEEVCPDARLVLAGNSPPAPLLRRARPSVEVTGYVADLDNLYRAATVFAAPNLTGAGVKFKVLDAMSHALPLVATPIATEGIFDGDDVPSFAAITTAPQDMARHLVTMLRRPEVARQMGAAAREWVGHRYDFDRGIEIVIETYERLISR